MPPTNTTPATAIDVLVLPYNFTQDVTGLVAPYTLWWHRTALAADVMLGLSAYAQSGSTYRPQITFWSGPNSSTLTQIDPIDYTIGHDTPCQFPVQVGTEYWIKVEDDGFGSAPGILVFDIKPSPATTPIPVGSIFINDDTESLTIAGAFGGIYASILDKSTGAVIAQARTTVGEEGAILTNGTIMLQNDDATSEASKLYLYDLDFNALTSIALFVGSLTVALNSKGLVFYRSQRVSPSADAVLITYDKLGAVLNTYTVTAYIPVAIAVKKDTTLVYMNNGSVATKIKKFTVASTTLADFANGEAGKFLGKQTLQVLDDDTLLAAWHDGAGTIVVKRYDTSGTETNSYSFTPPANITDGPRIAVLESDSTSFWIWASGQPAADRVSKFNKIRVSDGVVLTNFTVNVFEAGSGPIGSGNVAPSAWFGNSKSCPFLLLPVSTTPPVANYSGIYTITTDKTNDTLFTGDSSTVDVKIPDPFATLYPAGD